MAFRTGAEQAAEAAARPSFSRTSFLSIEDGKFAVVRMLTDHAHGQGLVTVGQHSNAPTRPAPEGYSGKWPSHMGAVCREDQAFKTFDQQGNVTAQLYPDCYLCLQFEQTGNRRDFKATDRAWGLGVEREQIIEDGKVVGMRDVMIEIERDGKKIPLPKILIMNFAWGNFWGSFTALKQMNGTWCDRDVMIARTGTEIDTDYNAQGFGPVGKDGTGKISDDNPQFDTRNADDALPYLEALGITKADLESKYGNDPQAAIQANVQEIVTDRSSNDFYDRFYDVRNPQPKNDNDAKGGKDGSAAAPPADNSANEPDEADLAALAARVQGHAEAGAIAAPEIPVG